MRSKRSWSATLITAVVSVLALIALSGVAAGSASAAACQHVASGEPSKFASRNAGTGACEGTSSTSGFAEVEEEIGTSVSAGVICVKVAAGEKGAWKDAKCETAEANGAFIKVETACLNTTVFSGQGSSLQKLAQLEYWVPKSGCNGTYKSTGSAAGLEAFGVGKKSSPELSKDTFVGSDDAPNGSCSTGQLKEIEEAAKDKTCVAAEQQALVIPVAQASIALLVNLPEFCELSQISNANLENVWDGKILEWSEIATAKGATEHAEACKKKITRIVRKDGSGTTYQFKHYLFEIDNAAQEGTEKGGAFAKRTWAELQEEPERNKEWPEEEAGKTGKLSPVFHAEKEGGGGEVEEVINEKQGLKEGTVGYANLGDAKAQYTGTNRYKWLEAERSASSFQYPGEGTEPSKTETTANCKKTHYSNKPTTVEPDDNWSETYGGHPNTQNEHYPICTLTWDVGLEGYEQAGLTKAAGEATKEYLEYVVSKTGGQTAFAKHNYREVEEAVGTYAVNEAKLVATK